MKISLVQCSPDDCQCFSVNERGMPAFFKELHLKGDLTGRFSVFKDRGGFSVKGEVSGLQVLECARTLDMFDHPFSVVADILVLCEQGVARQIEDDGEHDYWKIVIPAGQQEVDLTETIRQLIILQEPMIPVKEAD